MERHGSIARERSWKTGIDVNRKIKEIEKELGYEIQIKGEEYYYKIFGKKVTSEEWIKHDQKELAKKIIPLFVSQLPKSLETKIEGY